MELLARFELATSSLPTILEHFSPCAACRELLDKTLVYQGLSGFAYCSLLYLAVGVLCRFFRGRYGFVSVLKTAMDRVGHNNLKAYIAYTDCNVKGIAT